MGEMADDIIDQLMDEGHFYGRTKGKADTGIPSTISCR